MACLEERKKKPTAFLSEEEFMEMENTPNIREILEEKKGCFLCRRLFLLDEKEKKLTIDLIWYGRGGF